ncbi:MAG: sugar phosphate isomerase/epimerase [Defluviitaleaceae bacterium]|nr:sugar phosphate isomerase/epimerase [Defluviitaleaceae bacterium]
MTKPIVALQLYTVRDAAHEDLPKTLNQIKTMGYDAVELAGTYDLATEVLKKHLDDAGLEAVSAHVPYGAFEADAAGTVAKYKALGCRLISIPSLSLEALPGGKDFDTTKAVMVKTAALCKDHGLMLGYHNHAYEFKTLPCGSYVLDALFNTIDIDTGVYAQIDTGWVLAAGKDPVSYVKQYTGRCPSVHLKDIINVGDRFEDRPVGQGSQDIPAVMQAAEETGAYIMVVELDEAVGMTPLEAAKQSREYLLSIGY